MAGLNISLELVIRFVLEGSKFYWKEVRDIHLPGPHVMKKVMHSQWFHTSEHVDGQTRMYSSTMCTARLVAISGGGGWVSA